MGNWKANARNYFKKCYDHRFGQEHEFVKGPEFCQVIGYALYGEPDQEIIEHSKIRFGYSKEKADHIIKIQNKMYDMSPTVKIRVYKTMIWMYIDENKQGPTIAFKFKGKDGYVFIDASCRVYKTWDDLKKYSKLPKCQVAYPRGGVIQVDSGGSVLLDFEDSPAAWLRRKFINITFAVFVIGVVTTFIASFFSLKYSALIGFFWLMLLLIIFGVYGVARKLINLYDEWADVVRKNVVDPIVYWSKIAVAAIVIIIAVVIATVSIIITGLTLLKVGVVLAITAIVGYFMTSPPDDPKDSGHNYYKNFAVHKPMKNKLTTQRKLLVPSLVISTMFWTHLEMNLQTAENVIEMGILEKVELLLMKYVKENCITTSVRAISQVNEFLQNFISNIISERNLIQKRKCEEERAMKNISTPLKENIEMNEMFQFNPLLSLFSPWRTMRRNLPELQMKSENKLTVPREESTSYVYSSPMEEGPNVVTEVATKMVNLPFNMFKGVFDFVTQNQERDVVMLNY